MSFYFARRLHPQFVSILEQIFLGPLSCPRKLRLVQVPIFPPLSKSCSSTQAENTFWKEFMSKSVTKNVYLLSVNLSNIRIFWSPFLLPKAPFWSPFHSKSGPHFEKLTSPSHVGAVTLILSVFSYIVFTFLYSYIVVYVHFLPGPMTQGILCQGSLVCCFVKNSCIFSLFPKFLYF